MRKQGGGFGLNATASRTDQRSDGGVYFKGLDKRTPSFMGELFLVTLYHLELLILIGILFTFCEFLDVMHLSY